MNSQQSQNKPVTAKGPRLHELDALRGIAALLVVFYHYTTRVITIVPTAPSPFNFAIGEHGVDLFFIISGFVISLTLEKTERGSDFIVSRLSRLYPAYWVAVPLTYLSLTLLGPESRLVPRTDLIANFTMLQLWLGFLDVDGVYWTLAIELSFYFWMFVAWNLRGGKRDIPVPWVLGWLVWCLVVQVTLSQFDLLGYDKAVSKPLSFALFLDFYGHLFAAGFLFFRIWKDGATRLSVTGIVACLILHAQFRGGEAYPLIAVFFLAFTLFVAGKLSWIVSRPLLWLGSISYPLYLVHQNIGYGVIRTAAKAGANWWGSAITALVVSLCLAALIASTVEKPAMRWIRKRYRNRSTSS